MFDEFLPLRTVSMFCMVKLWICKSIAESPHICYIQNNMTPSIIEADMEEMISSCNNTD